MPISLNLIQNNPDKAKTIHDFLKETEENNGRFLALSFQKSNQKIAEMRKEDSKKSAKKKLGSISVSNTDTVGMCMKVKSQLNAKLNEIYKSDIDEKVKQTLVREIMTQLNKVEIKISEIKRRETAIQEEKIKKNETAQAKRKRKADMEKRTAYIRRDYLYSAEDGGFDPANPLGITSPGGYAFASLGAYDACLAETAIMAAGSVMFGGGVSDAVVSVEIGGGAVTMSDAGVSVSDTSVEVLI